ncbi:MAG: hypothetical protein DI587_24810 [Variovorax paradoxus]|nr:MAG: hypothetical protein DI583_24810 [Variovorax paradoxus]PZQ05438.1 MAG: hypothetical protein DI587_24810 [Variovorax paradoxus]
MYSATVWTDPKLYGCHFGATVHQHAFLKSFERRAAGERVVIPMEVDQAFLETREPELEAVRDLVIQHRLAQVRAAETEIASQSARLAEAQHRLAVSQSKAAGHSTRMAKQKICAARRRLESLVRGAEQAQTGRMFPGSFVPLVTAQDGRLVVEPMRYQCRPSHIERRMENLLESPHHARKDSLEGRWQREFGHTHAVVAVESFFESVSLHRLRHRNLAKGDDLTALELEFMPVPRQTLYVPCLWSHWQRPGLPDLRSFAMIVDRAPPEVVAVGQDWCPVTIRQDQVDAWLHPDPTDLAASHAILKDRPVLRFDNLPSSLDRERSSRPAPTKIINLWKPAEIGGALAA